jgi:hypothetical protein
MMEQAARGNRLIKIGILLEIALITFGIVDSSVPVLSRDALAGMLLRAAVMGPLGWYAWRGSVPAGIVFATLELMTAVAALIICLVSITQETLFTVSSVVLAGVVAYFLTSCGLIFAGLAAGNREKGRQGAPQTG